MIGRLIVVGWLLATALAQIWVCVTVLRYIEYPAVPIAITATMAGVLAWLAWLAWSVGNRSEEKGGR